MRISDHRERRFRRNGSVASLVKPFFRSYWTGQPGFNTRARSKSKFALPYICRLSTFNRFTCPSVWPLLQGELAAARTAFSSRRKTVTKFSNSGRLQFDAWLIQPERLFSSHVLIAFRDDCARSSPCLISGLAFSVNPSNCRSASVNIDSVFSRRQTLNRGVGMVSVFGTGRTIFTSHFPQC